MIPLLMASHSYAGLYIWVDEKGVKHFTDTPPPDAVHNQSQSQLREITKSRFYQTLVFKVVNVPDPAFLGNYPPIEPTSKGFPQYQLETQGQGTEDRLPKLDVYSINGKWMWRLRRGRDKYFSAHVREGTPADRVLVWRSFAPNGSKVTLRIESETFVTAKEFKKYRYRYDMSADDEDAPQWMKKSYRVSGHPDEGYNGIYTPVNWSSGLPRYKNGERMCLAASAFAGNWEWNLGKCERYEFTADQEPRDTMPDRVRKWYQRVGMLYMTLKITEMNHVTER